MKTMSKLFIPILLALFAFACSDSNEAGKGKASISITDAPIDDANVKAVWITVIGVEANGPDGWNTVETFDTPVKIDLLSYQNGEAYFLTDGEITAGSYSEVRLLLDIQEKIDGQVQNPGCYIEYNDGTPDKPLFVPSGGQSGYKAKGNFDVPAGGVVAITLDFDVRKAVVATGNEGKYILKPTVRLVANQNAGMIKGDFDAEGNSYSKVVVFAYANGTFNDSEMDEPTDEEVRFSNAVSSSVITSTNQYTLAFMESGSYDLYFVEFDENGEFVGMIGSSDDVTVEAGATVTLDIVISLLN
ncbi:MAG TPA: DUF4382 domain-containing protein [Fulvivirga sp.]|nr:DUF4382 domain-containing protein [Fulvivirga sp.]